MYCDKCFYKAGVIFTSDDFKHPPFLVSFSPTNLYLE